MSREYSHQNTMFMPNPPMIRIILVLDQKGSTGTPQEKQLLKIPFND